ncbi:UNVERIFIED_CONTAM: hypothetical protein FKN15_074127 [Acipenser sinensis]
MRSAEKKLKRTKLPAALDLYRSLHSSFSSWSSSIVYEFKCPVCSKFVSSDEMDLHLVMCLTKPRITYNEDVLTKDAGECAICLEELVQGDTIARLPCLCIYHKGFPTSLLKQICPNNERLQSF